MTDNRTTERVDHSPRVREAIDELMREKDATDNRTTELLPCPFCGGEAEFMIFDTICAVECSECFNGTRYYALDDYEQAVAAWNARAERTCRIEDSHYDELWDDTITHLSCGHDVWSEVRNYCPECGARIEVDE